MNLHRVRALVLRYSYVFSRNTFRLLDIFFWPVMDLLVWGFLTMYMLQMQKGAAPSLVTFLIGAIIFWDILYRAQQAVTVSFLEDVWSRNFLNIFIAPISIAEFTAATYVVGLVQSIIVVLVMAVLAQLLYGFNILVMGWSLAPLMVNLLLFGWAMGLATTALIVRWGHAAEALAWAIPFLIQPACAVFYPVSILPFWIKPFAYLLPATYVFEGTRTVLSGGALPASDLWLAFGLNALYMILASLFFQYMFNQARKHGLLTRLGS